MPAGAHYCDKCGRPIQSGASQTSTGSLGPQVNRRVMKCVSCRLINYSGETACKRCCGQLIDREAFVEQAQAYQQPNPTFQVDCSPEMEKACAGIKKAVGAGIFSGIVTLILALLQAAGVEFLKGGAQLTSFIDVALVFGLTFGIYRKSRVCAIIMLIYFVASKLLIISQTGNVAGLPLALFLIYCFAQGVQGAFAYHKVRTYEAAPQLDYSRTS